MTMKKLMFTSIHHNFITQHLIINQTKLYLSVIVNVVVHVLHSQLTYKKCQTVIVSYLLVLQVLTIQLNHLLVVMLKIHKNMKTQLKNLSKKIGMD